MPKYVNQHKKIELSNKRRVLSNKRIVNLSKVSTPLVP